MNRAFLKRVLDPLIEAAEREPVADCAVITMHNILPAREGYPPRAFFEESTRYLVEKGYVAYGLASPFGTHTFVKRMRSD